MLSKTAHPKCTKKLFLFKSVLFQQSDKFLRNFSVVAVSLLVDFGVFLPFMEGFCLGTKVRSFGPLEHS